MGRCAVTLCRTSSTVLIQARCQWLYLDLSCLDWQWVSWVEQRAPMSLLRQSTKQQLLQDNMSFCFLLFINSYYYLNSTGQMPLIVTAAGSSVLALLSTEVMRFMAGFWLGFEALLWCCTIWFQVCGLLGCCDWMYDFRSSFCMLIL